MDTKYDCNQDVMKMVMQNMNWETLKDVYAITLIKFKMIIGFPYLLARFSKWSLVAS